MIISSDRELLSMIEVLSQKLDWQVTIYNSSKDPLDVMSTVCESNPLFAIIDDDFLAPETVHILKSIRKVKQHLEIIFCTSDTSIELGKKISQLGIHYYAIKPFGEGELHDSINSVLNIQKKNTHITN